MIVLLIILLCAICDLPNGVKIVVSSLDWEVCYLRFVPRQEKVRATVTLTCGGSGVGEGGGD